MGCLYTPLITHILQVKPTETIIYYDACYYRNMWQNLKLILMFFAAMISQQNKYTAYACEAHQTTYSGVLTKLIFKFISNLKINPYLEMPTVLKEATPYSTNHRYHQYLIIYTLQYDPLNMIIFAKYQVLELLKV